MGLGAWFQMGGVWMYPILALGLLLGPLSLIAVLAAAVVPGGTGRRIVGGLAAFGIVAGLGVAGIGLIGTVVGTSSVDAALEGVPPDVREAIREQGMKEAWVSATFGLGVGLPIAGAMAIAVLLARRPVASASS